MCRLSVHNSSWRPPGRHQQQQNPPTQADRKIHQSQRRICNTNNDDISSDTLHSGKMRSSDNCDNRIAPFLRNSSYHYSYNRNGGSFKLLFVVFSMVLFIVNFSPASAQLNPGKKKLFLSIYPYTVYLAVHLYSFPSIQLSIYIAIHLSIYSYISDYLSIYLAIHLHSYPSI